MEIQKIHSQILMRIFGAANKISYVIWSKGSVYVAGHGHECVQSKFIILIGWARGEIKIRTGNELCWRQVKEKASGKNGKTSRSWQYYYAVSLAKFALKCLLLWPTHRSLPCANDERSKDEKKRQGRRPSKWNLPFFFGINKMREKKAFASTERERL